jgi:hypothetical protein
VPRARTFSHLRMDSPGGAAELQVSAGGLRMQAGWCEFLAAGLAGTSAPTRAGSSFLASSAAVTLPMRRSPRPAPGARLACTRRPPRKPMTASDYGENEAGSTAQLHVLGLAAVS